MCAGQEPDEGQGQGGDELVAEREAGYARDGRGGIGHGRWSVRFRGVVARRLRPDVLVHAAGHPAAGASVVVRTHPAPLTIDHRSVIHRVDTLRASDRPLKSVNRTIGR
ncbi:hypothetical protein GCM10010498_02600 [Streptomyces cavourensis]|nr:hypothetical protein GCM10010498_02600 [Streptomyces cavourensis]